MTMHLADAAIPHELDLRVESRRPLRLNAATLAWAESAPLPVASERADLDEGRCRASIVIVTYNNLSLTKLCVRSVIQNTSEGSYELIIVDNASTDGTPDYLEALAAANPHVRVVLNDTNRGFAPANNQGLAAARCDALVLLNNDTLVPPHWLDTLLSHLRDPAVGLVGPVTNRIGNEAEVEVSYETYGGFLRAARERMAAEAGRAFDLPTPCMFCVAIRRQTYERIGPMDERYEIGMLEDDDYAERVHEAMLRTVCAEDVLVHHFGQASFGSLVPSGKYGQLLEANKRRFEAKWGRAWQPYARRAGSGYAALADRLHEVATGYLPEDAIALIVSRGDEALLTAFKSKTGDAWHFPRTDDGQYAGFYPADGAAALAHLEALRALGATHLLVPWPSLWWLQHYEAFREHLEQRCCELFRKQDVGVLFDLRAADAPALPGGR